MSDDENECGVDRLESVTRPGADSRQNELVVRGAGIPDLVIV